MAHEYSKDAKASHDRKLKSYGGESSGKATNFAGFPALNTNEQAGRAPLNSKEYIPPETTPTRTARKKGGKVVGATSLKRLDKAPRKGKSFASGAGKAPMKGSAQREDQIPSGTTEQEEFDPQTRFDPGEMNPTSVRKKGGRVQQDYEDRSHESTGKMARKTSKACGGMAKGGMTKHEDEAADRALIKKMVKPQDLTGKKSGGRACRADGGMLTKPYNAQGSNVLKETRENSVDGRPAKAAGGAFSDYMGGGDDGAPKSGGARKGNGKTAVNIMIGTPPTQQQPGINPMALAALAGAGGPGAGAPPAAPPMAPPAAPPMAPPAMGGMPPSTPPMPGPQGGPPMPRATGGRTFSDIKVSKPKIKDGYPALTGGSGGGKGRREKILAYGDEQK
jgi:hypothetical protein